MTVPSHLPGDAPLGGRLGGRLDALAAEAVAGRQLQNPVESRGLTRPRATVLVVALVAVTALVVGAVIAVPSGPLEDAVVLGSADAASTDSGSTGPPAEDAITLTDVAPLECATQQDLLRIGEVLSAGLPAFDYEPAGSYEAAASDAVVVVAGTITGVHREVRRATDGGTSEGFTIMTVTDVDELGGDARDDVQEIVLSSQWQAADPVADVPDSLLIPDELDVAFLGFLTPLSGVRPGWSPGLEGLYVACNPTQPAIAVVADAAGPDDPTGPANLQLTASLDDIAAAIERPMTSPGPPAASTTPLPAPTPDGPGPTLQGSAPPQAADPEDPTATSTPTDVPTIGPEEISTTLLAFAAGDAGALASLPLADEVALALGARIVATASPAELADRAAWMIESAEPFRGREGSFDVLGPLSESAAIVTTTGPHPHCAAPDPTRPPSGFEGHVQVAIQADPESFDTCLRWFAIDIYRDPDTQEIDAISLDLWEP